MYFSSKTVQSQTTTKKLSSIEQENKVFDVPELAGTIVIVQVAIVVITRLRKGGQPTKGGHHEAKIDLC